MVLALLQRRVSIAWNCVNGDDGLNQVPGFTAGLVETPILAANVERCSSDPLSCLPGPIDATP